MVEQLPPRRRKRAHRVDDWRVILGIAHMREICVRWRGCPREYRAPYTIICNRFNYRSGRGIFEALTGHSGAWGR